MAGFGADTDSLADAIKKLSDALEKIEQCLAKGPPWFRHQQNRERAQSIEQEYQTQVKRMARDRPFQRVYKPP